MTSLQRLMIEGISDYSWVVCFAFFESLVDLGLLVCTSPVQWDRPSTSVSSNAPACLWLPFSNLQMFHDFSIGPGSPGSLGSPPGNAFGATESPWGGVVPPPPPMPTHLQGEVCTRTKSKSRRNRCLSVREKPRKACSLLLEFRLPLKLS